MVSCHRSLLSGGMGGPVPRRSLSHIPTARRAHFRQLLQFPKQAFWSGEPRTMIGSCWIPFCLGRVQGQQNFCVETCIMQTRIPPSSLVTLPPTLFCRGAKAWLTRLLGLRGWRNSLPRSARRLFLTVNSSPLLRHSQRLPGFTLPPHSSVIIKSERLPQSNLQWVDLDITLGLFFHWGSHRLRGDPPIRRCTNLQVSS